ncbi:MAG: hypothetical protein MI923_13045 [Phycisphaerales bacterium]|nr:hypothetical protein [Phycisphaerales bacterium]
MLCVKAQSDYNGHKDVKPAIVSHNWRGQTKDKDRRAGNMIKKEDYNRVRRQLQEYLEARFEDAVVQIGDNIHYKGTNVVVTSRAFEGLLAEQRFHHVVRAIPKEFYEDYLQRGVVWFELAPGESGRDLMKMPRASDVAEEEIAIRKQLEKIEFFSKFQSKLTSDPKRLSDTHFNITREILAEAGLNETKAERICLFMVLLGAFCDAHVLADVLPTLTSEHAA